MRTTLMLIAVLTASVAQSQVVQPRLADLYSDLGIYQTAYETDGSLWVGGIFDRVGNQTISNLVRFKPDGTLDTSFAPNPDSGVIRGIEFDSSGRAYVAGSFKSIAGQPRPGLARFNAGNPRTLDATYLPQLPASIQSIESITLRSDGSLYVAYSTTGTSRGIVRLDTQGQAIPTFVVTTNNAVFPMVLSADEQHLFIGGAMSQVNGMAIPSKGQVAKLDASTGAMDMNWIPFASGSGFVRAMVPDGLDHMILAGTIPGGTEGLARVAIAAPGAADIGFGPDFGGPTSSISQSNLLRLPDGDLVVYGSFTTVDAEARSSHLAKLAPDGSARPDWGDTAPLGGTSSGTMAVSNTGLLSVPRFAVPGRPRSRVFVLSSSDGSDSNHLVGAEFSVRSTIQRLARDAASGRVFAGAPSIEEIDGRSSSALVAFQADLTPDVTWNSNLNSTVTLGGTLAISVGPTRIALGGFGFGADGLQVRSFYLLDAANGGTTAWAPLASAGVGLGTDQIRALAIDEAGGYVYVVGLTRDANNAQLPVRFLNRFSLITGLLDSSWAPSVSLGISSVLMIDDGYLYLAGVNSATATDTSQVAAFARFSLTGNGKADPSFKPFASATTLLQAMDMDATHIYVGGNVLARIDRATGLVDPDWNPATQGAGTVAALSLADDGTLWVGGAPNLGCGGAAVDVARIQPGGVTDPDWSVDPDGIVSAVLWVEGGKALLGGSFRNVNGEPHDGIALIGPSDTIFAGEMGDPLCVRP